MKNQTKPQTQEKNLQNQEIDPNDPFGIGLVPYHPDLITFEYTGDENLLLDFVEPEDEDLDYQCYNCKRAKYEEKKRRRRENVKRKRRN
ncbi:6907_t:CDS:2 [Diversispora eburnea]|uniref:6907_t:CDS:1 n=1 Tax=Diversispora eburnea TaxID=1213867 RepID=A0A9N9FGF6_9GLOM|nr:6907_t:CDS:2 [Diversispora eburnea]